jgi:exosortase E/protease (VPEID-CTERM system)
MDLMSVDASAIARLSRQRGGLPWTRWLSLLGLLVAEVALITVLFDPSYHGQGSGASAWVIRNLRLVPQAAAAAAVVFVLFGARWLKSGRMRLELDPGRSHNLGFSLTCHLVAFAAVLTLSASMFTRPVDASPISDAKLVGLGLAGMVTVVFWALSALPLALWLRMGWRGLGVLAVAAIAACAACLVGTGTQSLWLRLSRWTFWAVDHLLRLVFAEVVCDPATFTIGTRTFPVRIAPQCSGYEGIGLIWVLMAGSFWIFRDRFRFPAALLLVPLGTALIWFANSVRIAALVAVGTLVSPEIALTGFHSYTGWLAFNIMGLGVLTAALHCRFFCVVPATTLDRSTERFPTAAYLAPLLAIVATAMVTGAFSQGFDRFYPLRLVAAAIALWWCRLAPEQWRPTWSLEAIGIGIGVFGLWMALEVIAPGTPAGVNPWTALTPRWSALWLTARVVGSVVFVPLAEELAFRGYLLRRMVAADFRAVSPDRFTWLSVAVSSAAFGALHGRWLAGTLAGVLYALIFARRGKLGDAVLAHAVTNALLAVTVLTSGQWSLW